MIKIEIQLAHQHIEHISTSKYQHIYNHLQSDSYRIFKSPNFQIYFFISTSAHRTNQHIKISAHQTSSSNFQIFKSSFIHPIITHFHPIFLKIKKRHCRFVSPKNWIRFFVSFFCFFLKELNNLRLAFFGYSRTI